MKEIRGTQVLDCSAERFWALYLDDTFTRRLFIEEMGWEDPVIKVVKDDEHEVVRTMEAQPKLNLPAAAARMISKTLGYHEDGRFDKKAKRWTMKHVTNIFGEKVDLSGEFTANDLGDGRCERHAVFRIDVKIFGVAGLLERAIEPNVHRLWEQNTSFTNRWVKAHPE